MNLTKFLNESITEIKRNGVSSLASIGTTIVAMFIFGMFFIFYSNITYLANNLEKQVFIEAYFKENTKNVEIQVLKRDLEKMENVEKVIYVDQVDATIKMNEILQNQDVMTNIDDLDLIPASLEVKLKNPASFEETVAFLKENRNIENVRYGEEIIRNLSSFANIAKSFGLFLICILSLGMTIIMNNMIRVVVYSKRKEIEIMRYLGATKAYISIPYILEGGIIGFTGSVVAFFLVKCYYGFILSNAELAIPFIKFLPMYPYIFYHGIIMILVGVVISSLCSAFAVRKHLKEFR